MAKACKESVVLLMLRPGNIMPLAVRIPVSSKLIFQRYVTRLSGKMLPLLGVVTRITLDKTTNKSGQPYAVYNFEVAMYFRQMKLLQLRLLRRVLWLWLTRVIVVKWMKRQTKTISIIWGV